MILSFNFIFIFCLFLFSFGSFANEMVVVEGGVHTPFLSDGEGESRPVEISKFLMDKAPVTNSDFALFTRKEQQWSQGKIKKLFADQNYLKHWEESHNANWNTIQNRPVVNVSWFAAKAYCKFKGKRLPTMNEWEWASDAQNPESVKKVLHWYGKTIQESELSKIDDMVEGKYGLQGMHGHIWEWVSDYNSVLITTDSRNNAGEKLDGMFCGGGSLRSKDASNYASFMRHAFRSGLDGRYTHSQLGFRCVKDYELSKTKDK